MSEPTKVSVWKAVRVTPPKVPTTLADCEERRLAVVRYNRGEMTIRHRDGENTRDSNGDGGYPGPSSYAFIRYLDDPQPTAPPVPTTFGELRDGQCFRLAGDLRVNWRHENWRVVLMASGMCSSGASVDSTPIRFIPDMEMVMEMQP